LAISTPIAIAAAANTAHANPPITYLFLIVFQSNLTGFLPKVDSANDGGGSDTNDKQQDKSGQHTYYRLLQAGSEWD
jgi:hypothetical protein